MLPLLLSSQQAAEDFAGGGLGDLVDEFPLTDFLEGGDAGGDEVGEFGG